jgi:uncharacterized coiled-coil protein SlyX
LTALQNDHQKLLDGLKGATPESLHARLDEQEALVTALESQKTQAESKAAAISKELEELKEKFKKMDRTSLGSLSGKVAAINKAWSFVVIDIGKDKNVSVGTELSVFRGETFIGKLRVVSVDANTSVADVLQDWTKQEIQVGDQVVR